MKEPCPSCGKRVDFEKNGQICPKCGAVYVRHTAKVLSSPKQVDTAMPPPGAPANVPPISPDPRPRPRPSRPNPGRRRRKATVPIVPIIILVVLVGIRLVRQVGEWEDEFRTAQSAQSPAISPLQDFEVSIEMPEISIPDPIDAVELACGEAYDLGGGSLVIQGIQDAQTLADFPAAIVPEPGSRLVAVSYHLDEGAASPGMASLALASGEAASAMLPSSLAGYDPDLEDALAALGVTYGLEPEGRLLVFSIPEAALGEAMQLRLMGSTDSGVRVIEVALS